jgi:hypothetical protein
MPALAISHMQATVAIHTRIGMGMILLIEMRRVNVLAMKFVPSAVVVAPGASGCWNHCA